MEHPELFDIEADISEAYDRAEDYPEVVARLLQLMEDHQETMKDALPDNLAKRIATEKK